MLEVTYNTEITILQHISCSAHAMLQLLCTCTCIYMYLQCTYMHVHVVHYVYPDSACSTITSPDFSSACIKTSSVISELLVSPVSGKCELYSKYIHACCIMCVCIYIFCTPTCMCYNYIAFVDPDWLERGCPENRLLDEGKIYLCVCVCVLHVCVCELYRVVGGRGTFTLY